VSALNRKQLDDFDRANQAAWNTLAKKHAAKLKVPLLQTTLHALTMAQYALDHPTMLNLRVEHQRQARKALDRFHFNLSPENLARVNSALGKLAPDDPELETSDYLNRLIAEFAHPAMVVELEGRQLP
jgi:hypothetical protein